MSILIIDNGTNYLNSLLFLTKKYNVGDELFANFLEIVQNNTI